ncbi:MAG: hypothetical protein EOP54_14530 [Sphingobacteriales bacterium]|nr:MAG: hypothetical protein EOP54_14530 [Sphingobacteriales bacterium]
MRKILLFAGALFMLSCTPAVRTQLTNHQRPALEAESEVMVLEEAERVPAGAVDLGKITIRDNGLTAKCDWDLVLELAKTQVRNAGGNLLKIDRHIYPGIFMSSCHQLDATIFHINSKGAGDIIVSTDAAESAAIATTIPVRNIVPFQRWRLSLNGGFSYLLSRISGDVPLEARNHVRALKSGYHLGADGGYFWKENIGLGLKYVNFKSSHRGNINRYEYITSDITTQFTGPALYNRYYSRHSNITFLTGLSVGYLHYYNRQISPQRIEMRGNTVAAGLDLQADFVLSKRVSLGCGLGYIAGVLKKVQISDGNSRQTINLENGSYEGMARLDVSAGIRYHW